MFAAVKEVRFAPDTEPNALDHVPDVTVLTVVRAEVVDAEVKRVEEEGIAVLFIEVTNGKAVTPEAKYEEDAVKAEEPKVPPVPMFNVDPSVPVSVRVLENVNVFAVVPPVKEAPAAIALNVTPLMAVVAVVKRAADAGIAVLFTLVTKGRDVTEAAR